MNGPPFKILGKPNTQRPVVEPRHPGANREGRAERHRVLIENQIGRLLDPYREIVIFKNGNKKDFRLENLVLRTRANTKKHNKTCARCGKQFEMTDRQLYEKKRRAPNSPLACSKSCTETLKSRARIKPKLQIPCAYCGKEKHMTEATYLRLTRCTILGKLYCGRACAVKGSGRERTRQRMELQELKDEEMQYRRRQADETLS